MEWFYIRCLLWITFWSLVLLGIWIEMLGGYDDE